MEIEMSANDVISSINQLHSDGEALAKKKVKKSHPDLMRSALHYFPSWEHAIKESGIE
ncbi:hypothetical protein [Anaerobacillus arseniciselenatis]|uniref:hypothetical protein n=1 Tax=Anaerobacillus arseniciselenatis TaxID=85682 RepID=UPI00147137E0|nr:hypothetical protein [Anaerobacillus arseniciselenatis]